MTDVRMKPWDDTRVTMRGEFREAMMGDVPTYQPPTAGVHWTQFAFVVSLVFFLLLLSLGAAPGNVAGFAAVAVGCAALCLVPFTIGPVIESAVTAAWPVLKWLLIIGGVLAFCYPFVTSALAESGIASFYTTREGTATASGRRLRDGDLTAAHKSLPFGTKVRVTNHRNGRSVVVTITDRGPFIRGRIIDLTSAGARAIGMAGLAPVTIERVN